MKESTSKKGRIRLDELLVLRGLVDSRSKARALIMAGSVLVEGERVDKAGVMVAPQARIEVKGGQKYVSRGGLKLEAALKHFSIDPKGMVAIDIGASTGGFTDCLLKHGAERVHAVDVGYGQLDWSLRENKRVMVHERINARYLMFENIGERVDIATLDVSFISLTLVVPPLLSILRNGGILIALIKPQFEVGKGEVGRGGIVRDETKRMQVVDRIRGFLSDLGFDVMGVIPSPIPGADGNIEYLIAATLNKR
ncbi:MAG: TlyA family RNA methyltransferase [Candidatus Caldarchaeum sp.]